VVSKYGPHERNDVRPHAARLGAPLLVFAGGAEPRPYHTYMHELADAAGASATWHVIPDAVHSYEGHEPLVNALVGDWLARTLAPTPVGAPA
jgi:hypothetical protein